MRRSRGILRWLVVGLLAGCAAPQPKESTGLRPATDRLLTTGDIQIAEAHLQTFGFDPGPVDGLFTGETQAAVRAFQARYGLTVSGLLDQPTRQELKLGVDPKRTD